MSDKEDNLKDQVPELGSFLDDDEEVVEDEKSESYIDLSDFTDCYTVGEMIASGGLKEVYKVRDRRTGRHVAMAKLKSNFISSANNERFLREARTLASLEHTNIVPIHEINYDKDGELFFTMKMLSGETLASVLTNLRKENKQYIEKFPQRRLIDILIRVCDAISYAHSSGIVHLDLKPENIQINDFGEVSVIDWGMAKQVDDKDNSSYLNVDLPAFTPLSSTITHVGNISGTPGYMSPEQARGKENPTETSDIYAIGAILYSIIYGQRPYYKLNVTETLKETQSGILPEFPDNANGKTVPSALRAITKKAMMPDSDDRYASVKSLQEDITLYLNDFATHAENINLIKFGQLFIKRHAKALAIIISVIAIICTVTYVSYYEVKAQEEILQAQNIKVNATAEEIIEGTLQKHEAMREEHAYGEIISNYEKLKSVGYEYPEFWLDEAKLYAGELNYKEALKFQNKILKSGSPIKDEGNFSKFHSITQWAANLNSKRKLTLEETLSFALNLDSDTQKQIIWNFNQDKNLSLKARLDRLPTLIRKYNKYIKKDDLNFRYNIDNNYVKLDLSNTREFQYGLPLYGLPIDELDISGTNIHLAILKDHLKSTLTTINLSGNSTHITNDFTAGGKYKKIVARNTLYSAFRLDEIPNLKHLDIEGSTVRSMNLRHNTNIEFINIAFTNINDFRFLKRCSSLKTLVINRTIKIPDSILDILKNQGTEIIIKEQRSFSLPGKIEAESFTRMSGIETKDADDEGGGLFVGWIETGDYLIYNVDVAKGGNYEVTFRLAGKKFHLRLKDLGGVLTSIDEPGTNDWQDWKSVKRNIQLKSGKNTLTLECTHHGWNINWMEFKRISD